LHGGLCFGDVGLHPLLGGNDIAAKAVACGGLLALDIVQGLRDGGGTAVDVVVAMLVFFDSCRFVGLCLRFCLDVLFRFGRRRLLRRLRRIAA